MIELVIFIAGFIFASGLFAMIDAAILSVGPAEVEVMIAKKRCGAVILKQLLRNISRVIVVIVILTNVTNILGPILAGRKAEAVFGSGSIGVITAILTFLTIIFSEIIPKAVGAHHAPRISRLVAPFLKVLVIILFPIVWPLEKMVRVFQSGQRKVGTEEQIRALANLGGGAGHIDADERELIHKAFVLNDSKTSDIMSPVDSMIVIPKKSTISQAAKVVFEYSYSRYPVTGRSLDDIVGYVMSTDILEMVADGKEEMPLSSIIRKAPFVNANLRCDDLLNVLKKKAQHLAIVRSKGKTVGLVTLEDVLEELVGEINDEGDTED